MKINVKSFFVRGLVIVGLITIVTSVVDLVEFNEENTISLDGKVLETPLIPAGYVQTSPKPTASNTKKTIRVLNLNQNRTLFLFGEVGSEAGILARTITNLSKQSKEPIVLLIDSPGGSVLDGEKVVSAIEASRADVYTVCVGMCASMAAIIHQYGTKRLATDRSVLMLHDAAGMMVGRLSEMQSLLTMFQRKIDKTNQYIANRSGIPYSEIVRLEANNFWIDSEDAQRMRLVDELVVVQE